LDGGRRAHGPRGSRSSRAAPRSPSPTPRRRTRVRPSRCLRPGSPSRSAWGRGSWRRSRVDRRRLVPRHAADRHAHRVVGPHVAGRAGGPCHSACGDHAIPAGSGVAFLSCRRYDAHEDRDRVRAVTENYGGNGLPGGVVCRWWRLASWRGVAGGG
jgi:hypothetical protein